MIRSHLAAALAAAGLFALSAPASASETDLVLTPDQMSTASGRVTVDEDSAYNTRTVRVEIPANRTLEPHGPKDGYFFVTVISGTLQFGFGRTFDETKLKTLPPGSVFSHRADQQHFARTGDQPVVLQITTISPAGKAETHDHAKGEDHEHGHDHHDHGKSGSK